MEVVDIKQTYLELGAFGIFMLVVLWLMLKYLPLFLDALLERFKKRDYRDELFLETIRNNTNVIENNNIITKNYIDNSHRVEEKLNMLLQDFKRHDERAEEISHDLHVIRDRRKET